MRLCSMMNIVFNRSETQATMNASETSSCQGVPSWFGIPARNDSAAWINEVFVASVNIPFCVFALLGNLAIILTIIRTPTLQKPCNTLLCSLAASDCLTAITAQPLFVAVRLMLFSDESTCSHQEHLFTAFYASTMLTSGLSFVFLAVISFDRHYALSKPLEYRARVTNKGSLKVIVLTGVGWFLLTCFVQFVSYPIVGKIFAMTIPVMFIVIPTVNHVRMFYAFRRHNKINLAANTATSQQLSLALQREKKVALVMALISLLLLLSLAPTLLNKINESLFPKLYVALQPWAMTMVFLISSVNPIVYTRSIKSIREGMKTVLLSHMKNIGN